MSNSIGRCLKKIWSKRIVRNIILFFPMLFIVTLISFAVVYYAPGDAATLLLKENLQKNSVSKEEAKKYGEKIDINGSFTKLYSKWVSGVLKGDFGRSYSKGENVLSILTAKYKITLMIAFLSILVEILISFPLGLYAGIKPGGFSDKIGSIWAIITCAIPAFWIGLICLWFLAIKLHFKYAIGYSGLQSLLIPAFIMGIISCGQLSCTIRRKSREISSSGFIEFAHAQGLNRKDILLCHMINHILPSALSVIVLDLSGFVGGAVIMEEIFNIPGFGNMLLEAIKLKDYPLISGSLFFIGAMICLLNLLADSIYPSIDARNKSELLGGV